MIKYCCWYCKKHGDDCAGCYNAAGGEEYFSWAVVNVCIIEGGECKVDFPFSKIPMSECWHKEAKP